MKSVLFLPLLALALPAAAQHTEIVGRAGLGLLAFGGADAASTTSFSYQGESNWGYAHNPYGRRLSTGFSVGGRVQRVAARKGLLAFDLGYDWLRSQVKVGTVYYSSSPFSSFIGAYPAKGSVALHTQQATAFLAAGRRFDVGTVQVDALVGPEAAYVFGFRQKGSGTYDGDATWKINSASSADNRADARLRAEATVWHGRVGANASYSHGLLNYRSNLVGADRHVYSRTGRLGLIYRLR